MANPPPIVQNSQPTLPRAIYAGSGSVFYPIASAPVGGMFTYSRTLIDDSQTTLSIAPRPTVTHDVLGNRSEACLQISFLHDGARLELHLQSNQRGLLLKIDDEYVSLDPIETGPSECWLSIDFGARNLRRIDIVSYQLSFAGIRVGTTDTVAAAALRGPRCICFGDSFTQPSPSNWVNWFADTLGWDDVWTSGVGASGYVADGYGSHPSFPQRVNADVIAYEPDVVFVYGSVNDGSYPLATLDSAVRETIGALRERLPGAVVAGGMNTAFGIEYWSAEALDRYETTKAAFTAAGGSWMSPLELPLGFGGPANANSATLSEAVAAGRPGNSGSPDVTGWDTGFRSFASTSDPNSNLRIGSTVEIGTDATRERVVLTGEYYAYGNRTFAFDGTFRYAHAAGEPIREVGPCYMTGDGSEFAPKGWGNADVYVGSDGYHHNAYGNRVMGQMLGSMLKAHLREIGRY